MTNRYRNLEKRIGIKFKSKKLLEQVFVHKSYVNEYRDKEKLEHNERLEFLGDAVLELVVTEYLYQNYPNPEGDLTNWRSALVKGENLAKLAEELDLGKYLYLSKGEDRSGGREKSYILANTVEALIGAIYLDKDYETAKGFVLEFILKYLEDILSKGLHIDAKSLFQELAQEKLGITPEYKLINAEGPDHAKLFTMGAYLEDKLVGQGQGSSKQTAEQAAAEHVLTEKGWLWKKLHKRL